MSTHVVLMKLTEQGAKTIRDAPAKIGAAVKSLEAMGGKIAKPTKCPITALSAVGLVSHDSSHEVP